jgi:hypothetical protein
MQDPSRPQGLIPVRKKKKWKGIINDNTEFLIESASFSSSSLIVSRGFCIHIFVFSSKKRQIVELIY